MERRNRIREAIENDDRAFGARVTTHSPILIEICGRVGLDYVWIDFEHKGPSPEDGDHMQNLSRAAENAGVTILARIPRPDPSLVRKALDSGIRTILISRTESAEELRTAIRASQFTYGDRPGTRGVSTSYATNWGTDSDYASEEDESVFIGALIETVEGYENIDDILSVRDVGFVWLGSGDMTVSLGVPLDERGENEELAGVMREIREKCKEYDVAMAKSAYSPSAVESAIDDGVQIINVSGDTEALQQILSSRLDAIADL